MMTVELAALELEAKAQAMLAALDAALSYQTGGEQRRPRGCS